MTIATSIRARPCSAQRVDRRLSSIGSSRSRPTSRRRSSSRSGIQSSTPEGEPGQVVERLEEKCRHPSGEAVEVGVLLAEAAYDGRDRGRGAQRRHRLEHPDHRPVEHRPTRAPDDRAEDVVASQQPSRELGVPAQRLEQRDHRARASYPVGGGDQSLGQLLEDVRREGPVVAVADLEQDRQGTVVVRGLEELLHEPGREVSARRGAGHHPGELLGHLAGAGGRVWVGHGIKEGIKGDGDGFCSQRWQPVFSPKTVFFAIPNS